MTDLSRPLLDVLPFPVAVVDQHGSLEFQNAAFGETFGEAAKSWLEGGARAVAGQRGWLQTLFLEASDDAAVEVELDGRTYRVERLMHLPDERRIAAWFEDVTARRHAEQAKSDFTSMIVHDLRGPLSGIQGTLEYVLSEPSKIDGMHQELLQAAVQESDRMMNLINELLDFSKIESGNFVVEQDAIALSGLLGRAIRSLQSVAARSHVSLLPGYRRDLPMILGSVEKLTQAIINLLSNALKFTPARGVITVTGDVIRLGDRVESVVLTVTDTGVGIPAADVDSLFQKYRQAGSRSVRGGGGTGLGLYIVKQIVEAHGGTVSIASLQGLGTSIVLQFPVRRSA